MDVNLIAIVKDKNDTIIAIISGTKTTKYNNGAIVHSGADKSGGEVAKARNKWYILQLSTYVSAIE